MAIGTIRLDDEGWKSMSEIPPTKHQMLGGIAQDVGLAESKDRSDFDNRMKRFSKEAKKVLAPKEHDVLKEHLDWLASLSWKVIKFILEDIYEFIVVPVGEYTYDAFLLSPAKWVKKYGPPRQVSTPRARKVGRMRI